MNFLYVCTEIFYGIGLAANTYAGTAAGSNDISKAKNYTISGILTNFILAVMLCLYLLFFGSEVAEFYTTDPEI